jgi:hypothetical protein
MASAIAHVSSPCGAPSDFVLQDPLRPVIRPQFRSARPRERPPLLRRPFKRFTELNIFRPMPYNTEYSHSCSRVNRFGAAPNRICSALRRGGSTKTQLWWTPLIFGTTTRSATINWLDAHRAVEIYTLMNWYKVDIEKKAFIKDNPCGDKPHDDLRNYA